MLKIKKLALKGSALFLGCLCTAQIGTGLTASCVNIDAPQQTSQFSEKMLKEENNIKIIPAKNYDEMCCKIANYIKAQIAEKPDTILGAATGSTYIGVYEKLVKMYKNGEINFSKVTSINLDEYVGLGAEHPQSYRYYMAHNLFNHVNIQPENIHLPNGLAESPEKECERYEKLFKKFGSADIQLLGLGHNGHIAFNEPGDTFIPGTHCVKLDDSTIQANKRFFDSESDVPRFAYTAGIEDIFKAKCIILAISDPKKAKILKAALTGPVTPKVPASILQLHKNVILVGTEDALALLQHATPRNI